MLKCVVIDDDEQSRKILEHFIGLTNFLDCVAIFSSGTEALAYLLQSPVDVLYVDINMPGLSGIELVKALPQPPVTIFTTSHTDFALTAFELDAADYLVKPIDFGRFTKSAAKIAERLRNKTSELPPETDDFFIKVNNKMLRLSASDIWFIEGLSDYVLIHTEQRQYVVDSTLRAIEEKLPEDRFARVHRSYIVNISRIESIQDNEITIKGKEIPISRTYQQEFFRKIRKL
ncbi:MAG: LytTR family DNA-binding domain-containing protein [Cytophagales bacterium]|nr:LytTR family DNA-binding domain-containing protein [Bernardetiaceae bacterium]MDW8203996.1 LytTR family DNA-binding domain-containing protein [Cytophagales bacterium]